MKIICDSCGTKYSISDDKVRGKVFKIRCKKCSHIIVVRGGENAAAEPSAAAAPVADGWHVVVDGEQVGPIAEADVRARIERGELKGDTYTWKEGFADWVKLSVVPEFAGLVGPGDGDPSAAADVVSAAVAAPVATNGTDRARRPSAARASLFGGGGGAAAAAAGGEDVDVFAAPASASARGGGDLFSSPAAHSAPTEEPRWPTSGASASAHDGGRVENLTGQRHENSVLFSLSNLQSLAMTSAAPKAAPSLGSTAPTPEGSGLIDIRAMAATTLGGPSEGRSGGSSGGAADDLPAFAAFSPAAQVLLPLPSSSGPPKWIYPVILLIAVMVIGIGYMAFKVVTAKPPQVVETVQAPPAPPPAAPAAAGTAVATKGSEQGRPSTIPDDKLPPREGDTKGEGTSEGKSEGKSESKSEHHHGKHETKTAKASTAQEKEEKKEQKAASESVVSKPAPGSIDALLEGGVSKKAASRPRATDEDKKPAAAESSGPLAKSAIVAGMNGVRPKVADCYNQYKVPGMAMVNVVIGKNGKVSSATVTGKFAGTPTGACVEKAVKSASFPPSDGFSTPYPFQLK